MIPGTLTDELPFSKEPEKEIVQDEIEDFNQLNKKDDNFKINKQEAIHDESDESEEEYEEDEDGEEYEDKSDPTKPQTTLF